MTVPFTSRNTRMSRGLSFGTLVVLALSLAAWPARGAPAESAKTAAPAATAPVPQTPQSPRTPLADIVLPESLEADVHTAWKLRRRVGAAYWPAWAAHEPAPLVVRGNPFDFFLNHPDPPTATSSGRQMTGGGFYYVSLGRLPLPEERDTRIEMWNQWWSVAYDVEGGRRASRADITTLLATRDFMVYEATLSKPTWTSFKSVETIMQLRSDPDLVAWLDSEATALRSAILTDDRNLRGRLVDRAVSARHMAEERAAKNVKMQAALNWYEDASRSEGAARYIGVLLESEARPVASGDTSYSLPRPGGEFDSRAKIWRTHLGSGHLRDVTGVSLGSLRELGAMYCVLLDASVPPGWQAGFFDPTTHLADALAQARKARGNPKAFGG